MSRCRAVTLDSAAVRSFGLGHDAMDGLIESLLDGHGQPLKSGATSRVWLHRLEGQAGRGWVVKRYGVTGVMLWVYRLMRCSRGWREWRGARRLAQAGVRCSMPLALVCDGGGEALILPYIEGLDLARWHAAADELQRRRVAVRIGEQIGRMTAAGIINRDHKAANLIVDAACAAGDAPPVIIDPAGLRRRRSDRQIYRMLALLYETASRLRPVPPRIAFRCLEEALRADPSIAAREKSRLRYATRAIRSITKHMKNTNDTKGGC